MARTRWTIAAALALGLASPAYAASPRTDGKWEPELLWTGVGVDVPVTWHLHLVSLSFADPTGRFGLQAPVLTVGVDIRRPSVRDNSISLSFVQAPLTLIVLGPLLATRESTAGRVLAGALMWLAGGTFRFTPGGTANLGRTPQSATTLSLAIGNDVAVHPFVDQRYVRDTVSAGLWLRTDGPWTVLTHDPTYLLPRSLFGIGAFVSVAKEFGGARELTPGIWASVSTLFPWD